MARFANFLGISALVILLSGPASRASDIEQSSPTEALRTLQVGHARYLCGKSDHPHGDSDRRTETFSKGQHPFAAVLACADSRVPVELLFDQGIGDLFVVRVAGNVCDRAEAGSLEYAVEHLHIPLVVVMGHRNCGAVAAALSKDEVHGNLATLVEAIRPAAKLAESAHPGERAEAVLGETVRANVLQSMSDLLSRSPLVAQHVRDSKVKVVGAIYDIEAATINWLGQHPDESRIVNSSAEQAPAQAAPGASHPSADSGSTKVRPSGISGGPMYKPESKPKPSAHP